MLVLSKQKLKVVNKKVIRFPYPEISIVSVWALRQIFCRNISLLVKETLLPKSIQEADGDNQITVRGRAITKQTTGDKHT